MKKTIRIILSCLLIVALLVPNYAFALVDGEQANWEDIYLSQEEFDNILINNLSTEGSIMPMATGLIIEYAIGISKSGSNLIIAGRTLGSSNVVRCGFKKVTIQRRANSSSSWSDYQSYTDLYNDARTYNLAKTITVASGYQYRVICTHYAKKNILSTQKIDNTSNTITM